MIEKLRSCQLLVFDFDGVMTDNRVLVFEDGIEAVFCNRSDGLGINLLKDAGYAMLILSTETNRVVQARAEKIKLPVIHGTTDKKTVLQKYCREHGIPLDKVAYVGNDINDLTVMQICGVSLCPADAYAKINNIASLVLPIKGGDGVIRHLAELIIEGK